MVHASDPMQCFFVCLVFFCFVCLSAPSPQNLTVFCLQGIERLKGETGKWGKVPCWEAMQIAFGGPFSLSWCSPFSGLSCKKSHEDHVAIPQGEIIEEDVIEIPLN